MPTNDDLDDAPERARRRSRMAGRRRPAGFFADNGTGYSLPHPEPLNHGENLASLVVRNAAVYGFRDPARVLGRIRLPGQSLQTILSEPPEPGFRGALATLLGLDQATLDRISYPTSDPTRFQFTGHSLPREFFRLTHRRYCPECLREHGFHWMAWDLAVVAVCPWHAIRLVDGCPACNKPLSWQAGTLSRCPRRGCGADLLAVLEQPVPAAEVAGTAMTIDALADAPPLGAGPPGLSGGELVRLAFQLGAFACGFERVGRPIDVLEHHPETMHLVLDEGWAALADWPRGFHALLERLRARAGGRRGRYGLRKEFGYLTHWLFRFGGEPWVRPVAEAFAVFAATQLDFATTAAGLRRYGSLEALRHRHMTMSEAARFLEVAPETMIELADREGLYLVRSTGQGAPSLLRADLVKQLHATKAATLFKQEAEKALGIGRPALRELTAAGLLPVVPPGERVIHQRIYRVADVEALMASLEAKIPSGRVRREGMVYVSLADAAQPHRSLVQVCQAVLDGSLVPVALQARAKGLGRIMLDRRDILTSIPVPRTTMPVVEAARALGVAAETARLWVKCGLLATVVLGTREERGLRVTQEALDTFRRDFVQAGEVAAMTGVGTGRWAAERLAFLGVRAASGPAVDEGEAHLFRRADLTPAILARLRRDVVEGAPKPSTQQAFDAADRAGKAAARVLGVALRRAWNGFADADARVYVQAVTGRRPRFKANYVFRFNAPMRKRLEAARQGWLALAFCDQAFFLLVPWRVAEPMIGRDGGDRHHIYVPVDGQGRVSGVFAEFLQPLASSA